MTGIIKAKFKKNQFHYTEVDGKNTYIIEPFTNLFGLKPNQAGYIVDNKNGLIKGEMYIVELQKAINWKNHSKKEFFKYYPEITEIVLIEQSLV